MRKVYTLQELLETARKMGMLALWGPGDFDADGRTEAFALYVNERGTIDSIYFINDEGEAAYLTRLPDYELWNAATKWELNECTRDHYGRTFFFVNYSTDSANPSYRTLVYGVKGGIPYELDISRKIMGFFQNDDIMYTTRLDPNETYGTMYPRYRLYYNPGTGQFTVGECME